MHAQRAGLILAVLVLLGGLGPVALAQTDASPLEGYWLTEGYGMAIEAVDGLMTVYQVTEISCLPLFQAAYEGLTVPDLGLTVSRADDRLIIRDAMTLNISARAVEALPAACADGGTAPTADPELNFEVFWHLFDEQYAFFDLHGVDWQAQYEMYRPQVTAATTDAALFALLSEMVAPLGDGHVSLSDGEAVFSPGESPAWFATYQEPVIDRLREAYVAGDEVTVLAGGLVSYRALDETTGYISILQMAGYGTAAENEIEAAGAVLDEALAALADKSALVVDVRFNGGGLDGVALALAGRFADQERLAYSKQARNGADVTPEREYFVQPEGPRQFTGPVAVLTSGLTASAAEMFVMAMQALPQTIVVGEPTSGAHSDILGGMLPNGWEFGLSNEIYRASDGAIYEGMGLPPAVEVAFDAEAFVAGQDVQLAAALAALGG